MVATIVVTVRAPGVPSMADRVGRGLKRDVGTTASPVLAFRGLSNYRCRWPKGHAVPRWDVGSRRDGRPKEFYQMRVITVHVVDLLTLKKWN